MEYGQARAGIVVGFLWVGTLLIAANAEAATLAGPIRLDTDPAYLPLLWSPLPQINLASLPEPGDLCSRLARAIPETSRLFPLVRGVLQDERACSDTSLPIRLAGALGPDGSDAERAVVMALAGRAKLTEVKGSETDASPLANAAAAEIRQALFAMPGDALSCEIRLSLGRAEARAGLLPEALSSYRSSKCQSESDQSYARLSEGVLLLGLGREPKAERLLGTGNLPGLSAEAKTLRLAALGDLQLRKGKLDLAQDFYRELKKQDAHSVWAAFLEARLSEIARLSGKREEAQDHLEKAKALPGHESWARWIDFRIACLAIRGEQWPVAAQAVGPYRNDQEARLRTLDLKAASEPAEKLYPLAEAYGRLQADSRGDWVGEEAAFKRAWVLLRVARPRESFDAFMEFLALYGASPLREAATQGTQLTFQTLVGDLRKKGKFLEAAEMVSRFQDILSPEIARGSFWLAAGESFEALGFTDRALDLYRRGLANADAGHTESNRALRTRVASILLRRGENAEAHRVLAPVLPESLDPATENLLAEVRPGDGDGAELDAQGALDWDALRRSVPHQLRAARRAALRGDRPIAQDHLHQAIAVSGKKADSRVRREIARLLLDTGDAEGSVGALRDEDEKISEDHLPLVVLASERLEAAGRMAEADAARAAVLTAGSTEGLWAVYTRARTADRSLMERLRQAGLVP